VEGRCLGEEIEEHLVAEEGIVDGQTVEELRIEVGIEEECPVEHQHLGEGIEGGLGSAGPGAVVERIVGEKIVGLAEGQIC